MRKIYYGIALLVFIALMALMYGGSMLISFEVVIGGILLAGERGIDMAYNFLMDYPNFFSIAVYLIPTAIMLPWYYFAFIEKKGFRQTLRAHTRQLSPICFVWVAVLTFAAQHATSLVMTLVDFLAPSVMNDYMELIETSGMTEYSIAWAVSTLILPPILEETVFRGLILQYLGKTGAKFFAANIIQAVFFGIFHMNLVQGFYTFFLGLLLGYLAYRYDSILVPMAMHFFYNLFGTALIELETRILPDFVQGLIVLGSVPLLAIVLAAVHFRFGEKKIAVTKGEHIV
ncbi:MAG TPA: CPBP family intramembrane metalloprotease [Candidatus Mediterraneibacter merdavium]|nr:CPBP family intramembrane metalloprotease [Candidatus Mediterraneibacter merdavium]